MEKTCTKQQCKSLKIAVLLKIIVQTNTTYLLNVNKLLNNNLIIITTRNSKQSYTQIIYVPRLKKKFPGNFQHAILMFRWNFQSV